MSDIHSSDAAAGGCLALLLVGIGFMVGVLVGWVWGGC